MTNLDYIRTLSAEELVENFNRCTWCAFIHKENKCNSKTCIEGKVEWLKQEYMPELKPCPFCGGKAKVRGTEIFWVRCRECNVETTHMDSKAEAIEAWNRRA